MEYIDSKGRTNLEQARMEEADAAAWKRQDRARYEKPPGGARKLPLIKESTQALTNGRVTKIKLVSGRFLDSEGLDVTSLVCSAEALAKEQAKFFDHASA